MAEIDDSRQALDGGRFEAIEATGEKAERVVAVLEEFGFGSLGLSEDDFLEPGNVIQLGHPPNRLDLLTQPSGVSFSDCWEARLRVDLGGVTANVIGLDDLIADKRAAAGCGIWRMSEDLGAS